jgi:hypothetical protein
MVERNEDLGAIAQSKQRAVTQGNGSVPLTRHKHLGAGAKQIGAKGKGHPEVDVGFDRIPGGTSIVPITSSMSRVEEDAVALKRRTKGCNNGVDPRGGAPLPWRDIIDRGCAAGEERKQDQEEPETGRRIHSQKLLTLAKRSKNLELESRSKKPCGPSSTAIMGLKSRLCSR